MQLPLILPPKKYTPNRNPDKGASASLLQRDMSLKRGRRLRSTKDDRESQYPAPVVFQFRALRPRTPAALPVLHLRAPVSNGAQAQIGCTAQTLCNWVRQAERHTGQRAGPDHGRASGRRRWSARTGSWARSTKSRAGVRVFCSGGARPPVQAMTAFIAKHRAHGGSSRSSEGTAARAACCELMRGHPAGVGGDFAGCARSGGSLSARAWRATRWPG